MMNIHWIPLPWSSLALDSRKRSNGFFLFLDLNFSVCSSVLVTTNGNVNIFQRKSRDVDSRIGSKSCLMEKVMFLGECVRIKLSYMGWPGGCDVW